MSTVSIDHVISTEEQIREIYRRPHERLLAKKVTRIDDRTREFIAATPFVLLATADAGGRCDVSPRGGPPGFVKVLDDEHLAVPDLSGNNILDSLTNILANPRAGLLFVVPGQDETLRLEGDAVLTTDPEILALWDDELRRPKLAIRITVSTTYIHCAKAFRRGEVWNPDTWGRIAAPDACDLLVSHMQLGIDPADLRVGREQSYAADLEAERDLSSN